MNPAIAAALSAAVLCGCTGSAPKARPEAPKQTAKPTAPQEETPMTGTTSPTGEKHPGEILNDDKVEGRTWTRKASEVPQTIAWVRVHDTWKPVVRIEVTGTDDRREFKKFGPGGEFLEATVAQMPPPAAAPVQQQPQPMPEPTPEK